jgi:hypothetical protein
MYTVNHKYSEFDRKKWGEFVSNHPFGNIFHSPEFVDLYNSSVNREPLAIACFDEYNDFNGLIVAEIQREYSGIIGSITARAIVMGGPLVKDQDPEIALLLIRAFDKICENKVVYSQFRNLWPATEIHSAFSTCKYVYEEHLNFIFGLRQGEETLWKNVHPTRKKQINRGLKRGVRPLIKDKLTAEEFKKCVEITKQVYQQAKLPCPSAEYFNNANKILSKEGRLKTAVALLDEQIVGFRFFLCYGNTLYDWYAGSLPEYHDKYPNDILPWEVIKWGSENQYSIFDFGGAGKPHIAYGVRDYKLKFGGELVNYGRFEKIHKPLVYHFAKVGFHIWKLLKFR